MKVCVDYQEDKEKGKIKSPSLVKESDGLVVLASGGNVDKFSGTVLVPGKSDFYVGEIITDWDTAFFTPFDYPITISNK